MKKKLFLVFSLVFFTSSFVWSQTIIDFETPDEGYTASGTEGSGSTDVFNRTNPDLGGNDTFLWAVEDLSLTDPSITLDPIDISGATSFTFDIDMLAHHYNDWDNTDELLITYSIDGGPGQNLMWVQSITDPSSGFNEPVALDTDFDGTGECAFVLPALSTGTGATGCVVASNQFETFSSGSISLASNSTLDIVLQFNGLTSSDEGIYLDNITITTAGPPPPVNGADLYALIPQFLGVGGLINKYNYDPVTDAITLLDDPYADTGFDKVLTMAQNPVDGQVYILTKEGQNRHLYEYDIENNIVGTDIGVISGSPGVNQITFGTDGTLYGSFRSGDNTGVYIIDKVTGATTLLMPEGFYGYANGFTYDHDNERLILTGENNSVSFYEVDITNGSSNFLFETFDYCTAQALDYVGNGKLIVSGTYSCGDIYTVDLNTQTTNNLTNGQDGAYNNIMSFILGTPPPPPPTLDYTFCSEEMPLEFNPPLVASAGVVVADSGYPSDTGVVGTGLGEYVLESIVINVQGEMQLRM